MKRDGNVVKYLYRGHQALKVVFKDSDVLEDMTGQEEFDDEQDDTEKEINNSKQEKKGNKRGASRNEKAK